MTSDLLRTTTRFLFFAALIVAPWFCGGTTSLSIVVIDWILAAAILLWILELVVNRRPPKFPAALLWIIAGLLIIGAWMTFNARSVYDADFGTFSPIADLIPHGPGSVDYAISAAWMVRAVLLLLSILFVVDLSQNGAHLLRLWQVIAVAGGSISLLGLLQKATGAEAIFWQARISGSVSTFFATYYYHANAGAYLNLALPFTAGLSVRAFTIPSSPIVRSLWLTISLLNVAAIASNTSRGAHLMAGVILIALAWQLGQRVIRRLSRIEKNVAIGGAAAVLFVIYAIAQATHLEKPLQRWETLNEQVSADTRWAASKVAVRVLPQVGLFGFGPGAFRAMFPSLNREADYLAGPGAWRFLHEDYLQTVLEWGWVGSALWTALFFGGIAVASRALLGQNAIRALGAKSKEQNGRGEWSWRRRLILPLAIIALSGVALHALFDFPLQIESIQLYVATFLGLCWGSARWDSMG